MDPTPLIERFRRYAAELHYQPVELARVEDDPILLLVPPLRGPGPRILVAAGFHGDEPGGVLAALQALQQLPPGSQVAFLPIVNPSGLRRGQRATADGMDANRGFSHGRGEPCPEVERLLDRWDIIRHLARDGFIALHDDWEQGAFYAYTFERPDDPLPGRFSDGLVAAASRFFPIVPDGTVEGSNVVRGVVLNEGDDSMEARLFRDGVPRAACAELPGLLPQEVRALGGAALVEAAVALSS